MPSSIICWAYGRWHWLCGDPWDGHDWDDDLPRRRDDPWPYLGASCRRCDAQL